MTDHTVFTAGPDGRYTRHSEGAFLRLRDGSILFVYSRFTGDSADDAPSDLCAMRSFDEGETWTEPETALSAARYGAKNIMSASLLRMQSGDVGLFFIVKASPAVSRIMLARSRDEGQSWYCDDECTLSDRPGYYVLNNDRVIRLKSGRILMPLTYHRGGHGREGHMYFDGRGESVFLMSDDDGATWRESRDAVFAPFTHTDTGLQENGAVELRAGAVWGYARTDQMVQYEYFSHDGGDTWTPAGPSRFSSPPSPMKISRREEDGMLYAVWNPIPNYNGRALSKAGWGRTPLCLASSADEGKTWSAPRVIEGEEDHGYCYPALMFTRDGALLAAYCAGGPADGACLARLTIRKLAL